MNVDSQVAGIFPFNLVSILIYILFVAGPVWVGPGAGQWEIVGPGVGSSVSPAASQCGHSRHSDTIPATPRQWGLLQISRAVRMWCAPPALQPSTAQLIQVSWRLTIDSDDTVNKSISQWKCWCQRLSCWIFHKRWKVVSEAPAKMMRELLGHPHQILLSHQPGWPQRDKKLRRGTKTNFWRAAVFLFIILVSLGLLLSNGGKSIRY